MSMPGLSVAILLGGVAASVAGMILVRRVIPQEKLSENNNYIGFTFSILSLVYGIYLAFTVVVVWQQHESAKDDVLNEVSMLGTVWRNVEPFAPEARRRIRMDIVDYARDVIANDFPKMEHGLAYSSSPSYDRLWSDFYHLTLAEGDARQAVFYQELLTRLNDFSIARRQRILASNVAMPLDMWVLLVVGAVGTIMFTWFFGTRYLSIQVAATVFLSALIIYTVLLVSELEYPFGGSVRVSPEPYEEALHVFESRVKSGSY